MAVIDTTMGALQICTFLSVSGGFCFVWDWTGGRVAWLGRVVADLLHHIKVSLVWHCAASR